MYGAAATAANDYGYGWHPRIVGDHSHLPMFVAMAEGRVKGMICVGQNPATSVNASLERKGLRNLEWLVVKDNFETETATYESVAPVDGQQDEPPATVRTSPLTMAALARSDDDDGD